MSKTGPKGSSSAGKPAKVQRLADFRPPALNPNKHTQQGMGQLSDAIGRHGYVAPMTASADGVIIDGSARLETAGSLFPDVEPIVVKHDGTRPIIMVRTDIPTVDDPMARDILVSANRVAEADLAYDADVLRAFALDGLDLTSYEFDDTLMAAIDASTVAISPDGVAFTPDTSPALADSSVTSEDVNKTKAALDGQFTGTKRTITEVTCPHCGKEFGLS